MSKFKNFVAALGAVAAISGSPMEAGAGPRENLTSCKESLCKRTRFKAGKMIYTCETKQVAIDCNRFQIAADADCRMGPTDEVGGCLDDNGRNNFVSIPLVAQKTSKGDVSSDKEKKFKKKKRTRRVNTRLFNPTRTEKNHGDGIPDAIDGGSSDAAVRGDAGGDNGNGSDSKKSKTTDSSHSSNAGTADTPDAGTVAAMQSRSLEGKEGGYGNLWYLLLLLAAAAGRGSAYLLKTKQHKKLKEELDTNKLFLSNLANEYREVIVKIINIVKPQRSKEMQFSDELKALISKIERDYRDPKGYLEVLGIRLDTLIEAYNRDQGTNFICRVRKIMLFVYGHDTDNKNSAAIKKLNNAVDQLSTNAKIKNYIDICLSSNESNGSDSDSSTPNSQQNQEESGSQEKSNSSDAQDDQGDENSDVNTEENSQSSPNVGWWTKLKNFFSKAQEVDDRDIIEEISDGDSDSDSSTPNSQQNQEESSSQEKSNSSDAQDDQGSESSDSSESEEPQAGGSDEESNNNDSNLKNDPLNFN